MRQMRRYAPEKTLDNVLFRCLKTFVRLRTANERCLTISPRLRRKWHVYIAVFCFPAVKTVARPESRVAPRTQHAFRPLLRKTTIPTPKLRQVKSYLVPTRIPVPLLTTQMPGTRYQCMHVWCIDLHSWCLCHTQCSSTWYQVCCL